MIHTAAAATLVDFDYSHEGSTIVLLAQIEESVQVPPMLVRRATLMESPYGPKVVMEISVGTIERGISRMHLGVDLDVKVVYQVTDMDASNPSETALELYRHYPQLYAESFAAAMAAIRDGK